jgi:integrase
MANFKKYKTTQGVFWEYRLKYKDPLTGKRKEKSQKRFSSKKEAQKAAQDFENDLRDGFSEENISLKDYIFYCIDSHNKTKIVENTYENKMQQIKMHILPFFQNIKLQDVKPMLYQQFIDEFAEKKNPQGKPYSRSTIENSHWILHSVFERAKAEKKIKENPASIATLKGRQRSAEELEYIPSHYLNDLLIAASRDRYEYYAFFYIMCETGMRKGEAAGLTWDDIDLENNKIDINKGMDTQKLKFIKTKTKSSIRVVDVPQRVIDVLKKLRKRQVENRLAWGEKYDTEMNLVFCRPDGEPYPKSTLFNCWQRYQRQTGIHKSIEDGKPKYFSIHAIRHSHAVICLENDIDFKTLQDRLGHGDYDVTMNTYAHVSSKMKKKSLDKYVEGTKDVFQPVVGFFN